MSKGIYKYTDLGTSDVVYVGKDPHIDKNRRYKEHLQLSRYDDQLFNRILQNNLNKYEYSVIWASEDCTTLKLNKMEISFSKIFNPKFNFDKFGKGGCIRHGEETKMKISESKKGKKLSEKDKINKSKSQNSTGYFRVTKLKCKTCTQGFRWRYQYRECGKRKVITGVSLEKLGEKVKAKGLEWRKLE